MSSFLPPACVRVMPLLQEPSSLTSLVYTDRVKIDTAADHSILLKARHDELIHEIITFHNYELI